MYPALCTVQNSVRFLNFFAYSLIFISVQIILPIENSFFNVQRYNFFLSLSKIKEPNTSKCTYIFGLAS